MAGVGFRSILKAVTSGASSAVSGISSLFSFEEKKEAYTALFQLHEGAKDALKDFTKNVAHLSDSSDPSSLKNIFFEASADKAITIPTASAIVKAEAGHVKANSTRNDGLLSAKDIYTSVKAALLDDDLRNEGIVLDAYGDDGAVKSFDNYTQADWHNIALSLAAARENGLHVSNAADIAQAFNDRPELADIAKSAAGHWNSFKAATHDVKPARFAFLRKGKVR